MNAAILRGLAAQPGGGTNLVLVSAALFLAVASVSCESLRWAGSSRSPAMRTEPEIRVRIRSGVPKVTLEGPASLVVRPSSAPAMMLSTPLTIEPTATGLRLTSPAGSRDYSTMAWVDVSAGGPLTPGPSIRVDGSAYPGRFRVMRREGAGTLDVIEETPIETYLPGVLSKELLAGWPLEAYKAQAVAARTYALHERKRSRLAGELFDVEATTLDQAYEGHTANATAAQAVLATRGEVMTYAGELVRCYYSSTCGGRAGSAADVWPSGRGFEFNTLGPIQGRTREFACSASPRFRWEQTRDAEELRQRIRAWGAANGKSVRDLGRLQSVRVANRNSTGRPTSYTLVEQGGRTHTLTAEELRVASNARTASLPAATGRQLVFSGDVEVVIRGGAAVFSGRGFGHGVGLCQYCANGFGERGDRYDAMLARFYPGATIRRAY